MKKLKLNLKNVDEILTREQLKQVIGGRSSGVEEEWIQACAGKSEEDDCLIIVHGWNPGVCRYDYGGILTCQSL